jgi:predicted ATPase
MLSRIKIKNFRCLREISLDLAPMTFIVGPNGSGKSSILMALQLLKQSIGTQISYDGQFIQLGDFRDVLNAKAEKDRFEHENPRITLRVDVKPSDEVLKSLRPLLVQRTVIKGSPDVKELGYEVSFNETEIEQSFLVNNRPIFTFGLYKEEPDNYANRIHFPKSLINAPCPAPNLILQPDLLRIRFMDRHAPQEQIKSLSQILPRICSIIRKEVESTYYISALRELVTERAGDSYFPRWVGRNGRHTVGLLALIFGSREYEQMRSKICKWANVFGLEELRAGWRGRNLLSADFRDPKTHAVLKVTAAGHGSVQMLPIITQMFWSPVGSTISFEEPEMSLHLELISKLPMIFSEVVNEGKQLIVTTHEQNVLFAFKPLIAKKELSYKNVVIYELKKSGTGSTAQKLKLTPGGTVKGGISSFVEAQRNIIYQWIATVPSVEGEKYSDA